jgi:hypothetical protein
MPGLKCNIFLNAKVNTKSTKDIGGGVGRGEDGALQDGNRSGNLQEVWNQQVFL